MFKSKYFITNTLPYKDIKTNVFKKVNNKTSLEINSSNGIPYGTFARKIMDTVFTMMITQKNHRIFLGKSYNEFMKNCGYNTPTGGNNGNISKHKEQWRRILSSIFIIKDLDGKELKFNIIQETNEFNGYIEVDENFYKHLLKNKIFIDDEELQALQQGKYGNLVLDLHSWLSSRKYNLHKFTNLKYEDLMNQFGTSITDLSVFKAKLKQAFLVLTKKLHMKGFNVSFSENTLNLIDFTINVSTSTFKNFQKFLKNFAIKGKYKISITFNRNSLFLSPTIFPVFN